MPDVCPSCGSRDIEEDPVRGESVCCSCGDVLSESTIISQVQFVDNANGQSSAMGQFLSHEASGPQPIFSGSQGIFTKESREITCRKAKERINSLMNRLCCDGSVGDVAYNFFKLSYTKGLTKGRRCALTSGACAYMACRVKMTSHMLIDISDAVEVDVYELGRTYLRLANALCVKMPTPDPCLYLLRFTYKLGFGEDAHDVCQTASRLVQRMMKDCMHTGRHPSGLCGAALMLAARYHNYNRTVQDVIKVVRVHESTIRKRLTEFGSTPSSELTPYEFMSMDLDTEEDPPSFKAARRKEEDEKLQQMLEEQKDITNELSDLQIEIERILRERKTKLRGVWAAAASAGTHETSNSTISDSSCTNGDREACDAIQFMAESTMQSIQECMTHAGGSQTGESQPLQEILPTTDSMGLKQTIEESMEVQPLEPVEEESGILDLEGIDDDEIDSYILTEREAELKSNFWMDLNKDYLDEQAKKKEEERLEDEQRLKDGLPPKKRKVYRKKDKNEQTARTAGEAMKKLIKVKKISNKIDYSVLKNLNGETDHISDNCSTTSKASSSRLSRSSKRSHPPIPGTFREIMQGLTGQQSATEAMHKEHDLYEDDEDEETSSSAMPRAKKHKNADGETMQEAAPAQEEEEEDDEDEEEDEGDDDEDDDLQKVLGFKTNVEDYYD